MADEESAQAILADRLSRLIGTARALMLAGRSVDLAGLRDRVGMLSAQMLDMPPAQARALLPKIHETLAELDRLSIVVGASTSGSPRSDEG